MLKDHLNKLEYFCIIVEKGSLLNAAHECGITQPQLSKIVKILEDDLGEALLIRSKNGMKATLAGEKLYNTSKSIINQVNKADLTIRSSNQDLAGNIFIGTYDSISRYFFPEFLFYIKELLPNINVQLETGESQNIIKKLKDNEIDIAITAQKSIKNKDFFSKVIFQDTFGFYRGVVNKFQFQDQLIYDPGSINDGEFNPKKYGFEKYLISENLETVKSLTEKGLGVGLLPTKVAYDSVLKNQLEFFKSKIQLSEHDMYLSFSKNNKNPAFRIILNELERFLDMWLRK